MEGDIEEADGGLKITSIRLKFRLKAPTGVREKIDRAFDSFASKCPAYQSVKGCIECSWELDVEEAE